MADCGFRSPHFSEEIAYLPPWLQSHQLPNVLAGVKDKCSIPMQLQNIYSDENIGLEQNSQQFSSNESGFNSCHLYLSGDTDSLQGSIPSTGNALHLSLHLSCTVSEDKNPPLITNHETSRITSTKPSIEVQETQTVKTKNHIKTTKKDTQTLSQADIEEAIELSIAASEAMVITEMVLLDSDTSHFPAFNALDAALLVKEARREMFIDREDGSGAFLEQEGDESGSFSDLDECTMAIAYADVGFSDKGGPDRNFRIHGLDSYCDSTMVPCSIKESTCTPHIFNFRNPCPNEENAAAIESEKQGPDNFGGIKMNLKEVEDNLEKDYEVAVQRNACTRKINGPFIRESSFISESMDTLGIFPHLPAEEPENEIVASNTPTNARNKCLTEGVFSSMDALCSVVPCSLSNPSMDQTSNEEKNFGIRDVQFNKAPQTFDKKHLDDSDVMLDEICEDINFKKNSDLKRREVDETIGSKNKRVRFLEAECVDGEAKKSERMKLKRGHFSSKSRRPKGVKYGLDCNLRIRKEKCSSFAGNKTERKEMLFQGLDFLLTGLSNKKFRELQALIRRYGGFVLTKLPDCPSDLRAKLVESTHWRPPVVICPKKVATTKFLYGCAINSWVLNPQWLVDSVEAGRLLSPSNLTSKNTETGVILVENEARSSRHLQICALEHNIQTLVGLNSRPVSWIIETLYAGELAPFKRDFRRIKVSKLKAGDEAFDMSQEI
ncbi:BRCA1 C Terminus (BRCT) domain-containing protein [Carex littledalei]|uniref:BRCA1 C Terminus (BRCT) domain-containing protein n=1 Tax=Carex littledalei TaxID=544730 RepID=A0A833RCG0_9POAL|nr:BRCA1 C Terminus (BRCT) domain-containing protein [Carex littledalei]